MLKYSCVMTRFLKLIVTPWNPNHKQSVELLINLSAVPGPLRAWQDPRKGAEEDTGSHSSKDVHRGMCFPLRSYQVPLTLLPSNVDVLQPEQDTILFIPSSPQRAEAPMEILSVCQCSYLCLWWVLILRRMEIKHIREKGGWLGSHL